jgi:hypothetical protein
LFGSAGGGAKEQEKETLALVKVQQLSAAALANARTEALQLDKNAYKRSGAVYR